VRKTLQEALGGSTSWNGHTFNEVFVGGRWRRLNYSTLGENTFGPHVFGLLTHVLTVTLLLYLLVEWFLAWGKGDEWFLWAAYMTLTATSLTTAWNDTAGYTLFLPVVGLIFRVWEQRWGRIGLAWAGVFLGVGFLGLWGVSISGWQGLHERSVLLLVVPVFALLGLWWVRWWAVRPPKLLLEDFADRMGGSL